MLKWKDNDKGSCLYVGNRYIGSVNQDHYLGDAYMKKESACYYASCNIENTRIICHPLSAQTLDEAKLEFENLYSDKAREYIALYESKVNKLLNILELIGISREERKC